MPLLSVRFFQMSKHFLILSMLLFFIEINLSVNIVVLISQNTQSVGKGAILHTNSLLSVSLAKLYPPFKTKIMHILLVGLVAELLHIIKLLLMTGRYSHFLILINILELIKNLKFTILFWDLQGNHQRCYLWAFQNVLGFIFLPLDCFENL